MLKIEEGKYYKDVMGVKRGPALPVEGGRWPWDLGDNSGYYEDDGTCPHIPSEDLIAEWPTGPVVTETVTKTRIVPGVYEHVTVDDHPEAGFMIGLSENNYTADELDAAAAVLSALAKGLRDA